MTETIEAVVLDLDGTLVDTPQAIATITADILAELGRPAPPERIRPLVGRPLDSNFAELLDVPADHADVATAIGLYKQRFGKHVKEHGRDLLYPGVLTGLRTLRERGLPLAIATSKVQEAAVKTVTATGIADLFDAVAGHDSVANGKPAPDLALHASGLLGVPPEACVGIGDGPGDMTMGRAAGMLNIAVTYGVGSADELRAAGADLVADSFTEAVDLVVQLLHGSVVAR
ncbi:HAD family hydrolase [Micromonospora sp. NPDC005215]|uniref:HAD family hydrolase n=1 Tax=Micromonospora sp. NPDC005215 TaxID=3157024 RepID=UPI0033BA0BDB